MATLLTVGKRVRVTFWQQLGSQAGINVKLFKVKEALGLGITDLDLANLMAASYGDDVAECMTNTATFQGCIVQCLDLATPVPPAYSTITPIPGLMGNSPMASQVSGILTLRTDTAGRAGRGRIYVPFPDQSASDGGAIPLPTALYKGHVQDLEDHFTQDVSYTDPINPALGVTVRAGLGTLLNWREFTSAIARPRFATQRRRGAYGKTNLPPF